MSLQYKYGGDYGSVAVWSNRTFTYDCLKDGNVSPWRTIDYRESYKNIRRKRYFYKTFFKKNKRTLKKIISFLEKVEKKGGIFVGKGL